jgi:outer membrane protein TolC
MLRDQIEAAKAGLRLAAVQSMPGVSVRASMAQQTPSAFVNSRWYAVGLTFSWAVLDGGKTSADTATAKTRLAQLEALLRDAEAGIALDVHNAFAAVRSARARTESAASQTKAAQTALDISVLRYEQRSAALLEVSSARLAVTQARSALARVRNDLLAAILECRHACAMDIEGIEIP